MFNKLELELEDKKRKLKLNECELKVALLGKPGAGKSSLCNTVHRFVTGRREIVHETVKETRGTEDITYLPEVYECCKIKLFDVPGCQLEASPDGLIAQTLRGVAVGTSLEDFNKGTVRREPMNRIDFGVLVVNGASFHKTGGWDKEQALTWRKLIKAETGHECFVFITHKKEKSKKKEYYFKNAFHVMAEGNVFFLDNYTSLKDPFNVKTELALVNAFMVMINRKNQHLLLQQQQIQRPLGVPTTEKQTKQKEALTTIPQDPKGITLNTQSLKASTDLKVSPENNFHFSRAEPPATLPPLSPRKPKPLPHAPLPKEKTIK